MENICTCLAVLLGCVFTVYGQLFEQMMTNPMAMAMMNGGGQGGSSGGMDPLLMSAMMNPAGGGETNSFNNMAMMNMMLNGNGASRSGNMFGMQSQGPSSNDTRSRTGMSQTPFNRGPNINDIMSMMMLSGSGGQPSSDTLQRLGVMGALSRSNTRNLNPSLPPNKLVDLTRDGVGVSAVIANQICPPQRCPFRVPCESPIITYKPETFFVCPECPKCPFQIMMGAMNPDMNSMGSSRRRPMMRRTAMNRLRTGMPTPMRVLSRSRNATASAA